MKVAKTKKDILKKYGYGEFGGESENEEPDYSTIYAWRQTAKKNGYSNFDPVEEIVDVRKGGYEWSAVIIFKNSDGTYSLLHGEGCSCNDIESCGIEIFHTLEELTAKVLRESVKQIAEEYSEYSDREWIEAYKMLSARIAGVQGL